MSTFMEECAIVYRYRQNRNVGMKLRIHENSLRLRLTQKEVAQFRRSGRVDAAISLAPGRVLSYSIESVPNATDVSADFDDRAIRVAIPTRIAIQWTDSHDVAIQASQRTGDGLRLELLIEKDFQCLHRTAEQEPDAYPNPLAAVSSGERGGEGT
jgi:hypothetical protein